jgi:anti-anti-sigma factor
VTGSEAILEWHGADGEVAVIPTRGSVVVRLAGHVDDSLTGHLESARAAAIAAAGPVDVDLRRVESFYSVGITFLVLLAEATAGAGARIRLIGPAPRVREVLVLTEVHDLFEWVEAEAPS